MVERTATARADETSVTSLREELCVEEPTSSRTQLTGVLPQSDQPRLSHVEGWRMVAISCSILLACMTIGIDENIVSTALPTIASDFHSSDDIGSYGSAFLLPQAVLQPFFGKVYAVWSPKAVYLFSLILFEVGSVIAATAHTSSALIGGRAVSGVGAVGLTVGGLNILTLLAEPRLQSVLIGVASATMGVSSLLGPLLGGIFIQHLSWRWCFWINLPIGGAVFVLVLSSLLVPTSSPNREKPLLVKLAMLDIVGTLIFSSCGVPLLLALQYGVSRPWSDPTIIALLAVSGSAVPVFVIQQKRRKRDGLFPLRILSRRNVWATCGLLGFIFAALGCIFYYLPLFFQIVQGLSPIESGLRTVAFVGSSSLGIAIAVAAMSKLPYLNPIVILGASIFLVAAGLFSTFNVHSSTGYVVGIQILAGTGFGFCILAQTTFPRLVLELKDQQICHSTTLMLQVLASSLSIQLSNIALTRIFVEKIKALDLPSTASGDVSANLANVRHVLPPEILPKVLDALSASFRGANYIGIAAAATAWVFGLCCEWKRLEGKTK